jgi:wyosine [tRNA(Phe)-imidazoG37] synthetase (radical SAM superfamily)
VGKIKLVLITNGSLIHRPAVRQGLRAMAALNGEVWFKLDSATPEGMRRINGTRQSLQRVRDNLRLAAGLCPTWLQTCVFAVDGKTLSSVERHAYLDFVRSALGEGVTLRGVLLYGLARTPMGDESARLSEAPKGWMVDFAAEIEALGLPVKLSQ